MFGRRPDGRRVKGIDPVMQITPYVMPMRCDAQVFLKHWHHIGRDLHDGVDTLDAAPVGTSSEHKKPPERFK